MSRYIDVDVAIEKLNNMVNRCKEDIEKYKQNRYWNWNASIENRKTMIDCLEGDINFLNEQPTADVRENVRGEWEDNYPIIVEFESLRCNQCHSLVPRKNFCCNCGAIMSESLKWHEIGKSLVDGIQDGIKGGKDK